MSTDGILHPTPDRLESYVEGALDDSERVVIESHLVTCARCQAEVDEWKALFTALSSLPRFAPSPGFADRVMAGVTVRRPLSVRVLELLRRLIPTGTAGWLLVTALLALPVVVTGGLLTWLLSRPGVTPLTLWLFVRDRVSDGIMSLAGRASASLLENSTAQLVWEFFQRVIAGADSARLGVAAAMFAVLTVIALWILYDNLFRTSTREKHHVLHCI